MPNVYKINHFFRLHAQGWSETYYRESTDAVTAATVANNLITKSLGVRAQGVVFQAVRAARIDGERESFLNKIERGNDVGIVRQDFGPDVTAVSAELRFISPTGRTRYLWLRGLPDAQTVRNGLDGVSVVGEAYGTKLSQLHVALRAEDYKMRVVSQAASLLRQVTGIISEPGNSPNVLKVMHAGGALGGVYGDSVRFIGPILRQFPLLKGKHKIISSAADHVLIALASDITPIAVLAPVTGQIKRYAFELQTLFTYQFSRFGTHDTGRPIDTPRGRRRKRAR